MYFTWSDHVTFTYKWTGLLWAPFYTTHCIQATKASRLQPLCLDVVQGLVTALTTVVLNSIGCNLHAG